MNINERKEDEIVILELHGKIDVNSSKVFQDKFNEIAGRGEKYIVLDSKGLSYVSSSGLRVFLMFLKHLNKIGGKLVICSMSEIIFEVFEISGFVPIFNIADDLDGALKQF